MAWGTGRVDEAGGLRYPYAAWDFAPGAGSGGARVGVQAYRATKSAKPAEVERRWLVVDATDLPEARIGDNALLFGRQGDQVLPVEELAEAAGTIFWSITPISGISSSPPVVVPKRR